MRPILNSKVFPATSASFMRQGWVCLIIVVIIGFKPIYMLGSSHFVGRSFRALRSKIAVNAKSQSRSYYRPRYLSSSSLLAEWCYGNYDESGVPRFGEPTYTSSLGDEFNGSRGNNLKSSSVSPLTMTAFDDAMPEPRFSSVNENYDSYDGGDGVGKVWISVSQRPSLLWSQQGLRPRQQMQPLLPLQAQA